MGDGTSPRSGELSQTHPHRSPLLFFYPYVSGERPAQPRRAAGVRLKPERSTGVGWRVSLGRVCDQTLCLIMKSCLCSALSATNLPVADKIDLEVWTLLACLQAARDIFLPSPLCRRWAVACAARWTGRLAEHL